MRWLCLLALTAALAGCDLLAAPSSPLTPTAAARYRAHAAGALYQVILAGDDFTPAPPDDTPSPTTCNVCNGTKRSGDGLGPCPCGDRCQCTSSQPPGSPPHKFGQPEQNLSQPPQPPQPPAPPVKAARARRILYFTAAWCPTCRPLSDKVLPTLTQVNPPWEIGKEDWNHVEIVDFDDLAKRQLFEMYKVSLMPAFLLVENGRELARLVPTAAKPNITQWDIGELFNYQIRVTPITGTPKAAASAPVMAQPVYTQPVMTMPMADYAATYGYPMGARNINRHLQEHGWTYSDFAGRSSDAKQRMHGYSHGYLAAGY